MKMIYSYITEGIGRYFTIECRFSLIDGFTKVYAAVYTKNCAGRRYCWKPAAIKGLLQLKDHFKPEGGCSFISRFR
jgi:hypothetical protein